MDLSGSSIDKFEGKIAIITGGNSGIGYATALELAKFGFTVILACRDQNKAILAAKKLRFLSRNKNVISEMLDLSDFKSIKNFVKNFKAKYSCLHVLINNAGVVSNEWETNKDGIELQFAVNHLGHFLLTNLLLDVLKKSTPSRIINVSSGIYTRGKIEWDDINLEESYGSVKAYSQSKLANVLFTVELAKRLEGTGVAAVALHPGFVRTQLMRSTRGCLGCCCGLLTWCFAKAPQAGAQTTVYCAIADDIMQHSGSFYADRKVQKLSNNVNEEDAEKLWKMSTKMIKKAQSQ